MPTRSHRDTGRRPGETRFCPAPADLGAHESVAAAETPTAWCWSSGKRALDLVLGFASLPIVIPLTAVLGAISAVVYRANPLFRQTRRGVDEEQFAVIKIRSLPASFPERHGKHDIHHHEFTGWSRFLRQSHLDELPQIVNILCGSMSIVGPRPMIDEVIDQLEPIDRTTRSMVKPGLSGPWQISTMGSVALHDHPELDNAYVEHASFVGDVRIIWLTFQTMLGRPALEPSALLRRLGW